MNPLVELAQSNLESLRAGFAHGSLKYGVTPEGLTQNGTPADSAGALSEYLGDQGFSSEVVVALIDAILDSRAHAHNVVLSQCLVVTGPDVSHAENLKTGSRFLQVVDHAKRELMLATFAIYRGDQILEPIHQVIIRNPDLEVTLILNIPRSYGDKTLTSELVEKHRQEFYEKSPRDHGRCFSRCRRHNIQGRLVGHAYGKIWQQEIACMWRFTKNNGITGGFHRKIKLIERRAYGFRNFENHRLRVLAQCG